MSVQLALYKGQPDGFKRRLLHAVVRLVTDSRYSHCELAVDGVCLSSSATDGGVRAKEIDLTSGRWDVVEIDADRAQILNWFEAHAGQGYDSKALWRFVFPQVKGADDKWFCSEACAAALGFENPEFYTPQHLAEIYASV